jgi:DNA-binding beta-propeller fold protein YncE
MLIISIPVSVDTATVVSYRHVTSNGTPNTIKGEPLWEYKDASVLTDPLCVTVDNNSNVYVTSNSYNMVVVVEPDGRQGRQLISSDDGLNEPTGIYFDKSKNSLLVTSDRGLAFLYHMC